MLYVVTSSTSINLKVTRVFSCRIKAEEYSRFLKEENTTPNVLLEVKAIEDPKYLVLVFSKKNKTRSGRLFTDKAETAHYALQQCNAKVVFLFQAFPPC